MAGVRAVLKRGTTGKHVRGEGVVNKSGFKRKRCERADCNPRAINTVTEQCTFTRRAPGGRELSHVYERWKRSK